MLADHFREDIFPYNLAPLILFIPLVLIAEATFIKSIKYSAAKIFFFIQSILFSFGWFWIYFIMSFRIFVNGFDLLWTFYFILTYLSIFPVWSLLPSLNHFSKMKFAEKYFRALSLSRNKE
jgi:hypothetical protein